MNIYKGKFKVTSPYGQRVLNGVSEFHNGIDVVGVTNKRICAAVAGRVLVSQIITDRNNLTWQWGNYVCVQGVDGNKYYYCHMSQRLVSAGKQVKAGDHIGVEGNTGYSFGSHCHFEVRNAKNQKIDPSPFLGIPNKVGEYDNQYRDRVKEKFGLSEGTLKYLDAYAYADDLYAKLAEK